jgi:hypothetical protein
MINPYGEIERGGTMPRDPRAARTLISELEALVSDLKVERDDPDGLGVHRTFRLTSATYKGLDDTVHVVADDRITDVTSIGKGVEVTFNHLGRIADNADPFNAADAAETLLTKKRVPKKKPAPPKDED